MLLKDFIPPPQTKAFVQCYRVVHFNFSEPPPVKPYTPRPEVCLAFYPFDRENISYNSSTKLINKVPVALVGQHLEITNRTILGLHFLALQIIFQPGAFYKLTGIPMNEINNLYLSADEVLGPEIKFINEQLFHANDYQQMVGIVNAYVLDLIHKQKKRDHKAELVFSHLLHSNGACSLDQLASNACLSVKQFERYSKDRVGVSPKLFARLIRFDHAFRLKNANPELDWLSIAVQCNYYDYQHLVRDYKDFTGLSPTQFHALQTPEGKLGMEESFYKIELLKHQE